jgi:hypothetical protein
MTKRRSCTHPVKESERREWMRRRRERVREKR